MMILASAVLAGSLLATGAQARGGGGGGGGHGGGFGGGHMGGFGGAHIGGFGGGRLGGLGGDHVGGFGAGQMAHAGREHFGAERRRFGGCGMNASGALDFDARRPTATTLNVSSDAGGLARMSVNLWVSLRIVEIRV